jgi:hypothetical protein
MHTQTLLPGIIFALGFLIGAPGAFAQNNPPPAGNVIYSLTGQTMSGTYQEGTADFIATEASTDISFAIREDPAYIELSDISLVDLTAGSGNLLTNGDFSGSTYSSAGGLPQPDGWNYLNIYNATASGRVLGDCGFTANGNCYYDGSVGSYDAIDQAVATTIGDAYQISFYYLDTDANSIYAPQGDGTGRDMFVYAGDAPTAAVPEPASIAIFAAGLLGLAAVQRRRML